MTGINFNNLNSQLSSATQVSESRLQDSINSYNPETASSADLLNLQMQMQQWTMVTQLQSSTMKSIGDAMKNIIQNLR